MDDTKKMQNNNLYRIKPIFIMLFSLLCFKELKRNIQKKKNAVKGTFMLLY